MISQNEPDPAQSCRTYLVMIILLHSSAVFFFIDLDPCLRPSMTPGGSETTVRRIARE